MQEGYEAAIYSRDEAKNRIDGYHGAITKAEQEIERVRHQVGTEPSESDIDALSIRLREMAEKHLDEAEFEEKLDIINKLNVKVYPSEDLKIMRIRCGVKMTFQNTEDGDGLVQCGKIIFGSPNTTIRHPGVQYFCQPLPWRRPRTYAI